MKNKIIVVLMAAAIVLPAMAQLCIAQETNTQFQSTSTLSGSGSTYSSTPMLSSDGTAAYDDASNTQAQTPGKPRKVGPPTPGGDPTPVGDAILPLLLIVMAYITYTAIGRHKSTTEA